MAKSFRVKQTNLVIIVFLVHVSFTKKTILFPSRQSALLLYNVSRDRLSEILNAYASYLLFHKPLTFYPHLRVGVHLMQQKWIFEQKEHPSKHSH